MHVNSNNDTSMVKLINRVASEIGEDKRFTVYIRELSRLGGKNDMSLPILGENKDAVKRLIRMSRGCGLKTNVNEDADEYTGSYICCAAKPNSFVIRSNGSISKCTVALYEDYNMIGRLLRNGTMEIDSHTATAWSRGIFSGDKTELGCPLINFPKEKFVDSKSTVKT